MPNHVTNIIQLSGDAKRIAEALAAIQNDGFGIGSISFQKLIPMPESLNIESGTRTARGLSAYRDFVDIYLLGRNTDQKDVLNIPRDKEAPFLRIRRDIREEEWELGRAAFRNIMLHGASTWYEWCNQNWGTKWDAYGFDEFGLCRDGSLRFLTAWAPPHPVIERLAETYPEFSILHEWADENLGHNCGRREYANGGLTEEYLPDYGPDSLQFASGILGIDLEDLEEWGEDDTEGMVIK